MTLKIVSQSNKQCTLLCILEAQFFYIFFFDVSTTYKRIIVFFFA